MIASLSKAQHWYYYKITQFELYERMFWRLMKSNIFQMNLVGFLADLSTGSPDLSFAGIQIWPEKLGENPKVSHVLVAKKSMFGWNPEAWPHWLQWKCSCSPKYRSIKKENSSYLSINWALNVPTVWVFLICEWAVYKLVPKGFLQIIHVSSFISFTELFMSYNVLYTSF